MCPYSLQKCRPFFIFSSLFLDHAPGFLRFVPLLSNLQRSGETHFGRRVSLVLMRYQAVFVTHVHTTTQLLLISAFSLMEFQAWALWYMLLLGYAFKLVFWLYIWYYSPTSRIIFPFSFRCCVQEKIVKVQGRQSQVYLNRPCAITMNKRKSRL